MTNKHPHAEIIKAKADNMDLVVFVRMAYGGDWSEVSEKECLPSFHPDNEYFACLPQHKEACLGWLNGGEIQWSDDFIGWTDKGNYINDLESQKFFPGNAFMLDDNKFRTKPRKETRHVVIHNGRLVGELFKFDSDIRASYGAEYHDLQIFQIQIEV